MMRIFLMDLRLFLRDSWAFAGALVLLVALVISVMVDAPLSLRYVLGGLLAVFTLIFLVKGSMRPVVNKDGKQLTVKEINDAEGGSD